MTHPRTKRVTKASAISRLRAASRSNVLTLSIGAGASADSGLPQWDTLMATVFLQNVMPRIEATRIRAPTQQAIAQTW